LGGKRKRARDEKIPPEAAIWVQLPKPWPQKDHKGFPSKKRLIHGSREEGSIGNSEGMGNGKKTVLFRVPGVGVLDGGK